MVSFRIDRFFSTRPVRVARPAAGRAPSARSVELARPVRPPSPSRRTGSVPAGGSRPALLKRFLRRPAVLHAIAAANRFSARLGWQFAAAITYFSFLALVPVIMVVFSAAGFILIADQSLLLDLRVQVATLLPHTSIFKPVNEALDQAVASRLPVGILGLVFALYSGISWMGNVRSALQAQWRPDFDDNQEIAAESLPHYYWKNFRYLLVLGSGLLMSILLTVVGTWAPREIMKLIGVRESDLLTGAFSVVPIALAVVGDTVIFYWVYAVLSPQATKAPHKAVLRGAFFAAIAFEILKLALTLFGGTIGKTPAGSIFGSVIGILLFFYATALVVLFLAAWIATSASAHPERVAASVPDVLDPTTGATPAPGSGPRSGPVSASDCCSVCGRGGPIDAGDRPIRDRPDSGEG